MTAQLARKRIFRSIKDNFSKLVTSPDGSSATTQEEKQMELSDKKLVVDELLKKGVWFSIFWLLGFGSFIAVKNGLKARKIINDSNGRIKPDGRVWWCFIVGGLGLSFWLFVLLMAFLNNGT